MVAMLSSSRQGRVVRCRVGEDSFAIGLESVRGFQRADRLVRTSGEDPRLGHLPTDLGDLPVFGLAELLGRSAGPTRLLPHIILMKTGQDAWGLLTDQVSQGFQFHSGVAFAFPRFLRQWPAIPARALLMEGDRPQLVLSAELLRPGTGAPTWRDTLASEEPDSLTPMGNGSGRLLMFRLGNEVQGERPLAIGVSLSWVQEIVEVPPITPVPRTPEYVVGLTSWRSRPLPVIDLAMRLTGDPGTSTPRDRQSRLLVVHLGDQIGLVGILVGAGLRVLTLPVEHGPCDRKLPVEDSLLHGAVELARETVLVPHLSRVASADY